MRTLSRAEIAAILIVALILGAAGFVSGFFWSSNAILIISKQINLIELCSLLTTLFGIVVISYYLDRQKEITKLQHEIFIKRVDELYENLSIISPLMEDGPIELSEVNIRLKKISYAVIRIGKVIKMVMNRECKFVSESMELHKRLRNLMTDTPPKSAAKSEPVDIKVEKGKILYSQSRKEQIEGVVDEMETLLLRQHLEITRPL